MSEYGFRVSLFTIGGSKKTSGDSMPFDSPLISSDGALGAFRNAIAAVKEAGPERDRNGHHNEILKVYEGPHFILCIIKGGGSGDDYMVTPPDGAEDKAQVSADDALTWPSRVLYLFPPGGSHQGIQVMETRGNSSHGTATNARLNDWLLKNMSLDSSFHHDVADGHAWQKVLAAEEASLEAIEFASAPGDSSSFPEEVGVESIKVRLVMDPERPVRDRLLDIFTPIKDRRKAAAVKDVLRAVGGTSYDDELANGTAKAEISVGGKKRSIRLNQRSSWFTRAIDSPLQLDNHAFLMEVQGDILDLAGAEGIPLPQDPLPLSMVPEKLDLEKETTPDE